MAMTPETKKARRKYRLLTMLSFLLFAGPLLYFTLMAFLSGEVAVVEKLALSGTFIAVGLFSALSAINHTLFRSKIFIILIGLYVCLGSIIGPLLTIGICQIVEELIVSPLRGKAKMTYTANKVYDARLPKADNK